MLALVFSLSGCTISSEISDESFSALSMDDLVVGIRPFREESSCLDYGILCGSDSKLKVLDYESGESIILCGDTNCRHNDEECPAWFDPYVSMVGAAIYYGKVYYFLDDMTAIRLYSQSPAGNQQKVIWQESRDDVSVGTYSLSGIGSVIYHGGYVWIELQYTALLDEAGEDVVDTSVVVGINLETGKAHELTQLPELDEETEERLFSEISYVGEGSIITDTVRYSLETNGIRQESYVLHDIETLSSRIIHESEQVRLFEKTGEIGGYLSELEFLGKYGDRYVCTIYTDENANQRGNNRNLYFYNDKDDTFQALLEGVSGFPFYEARYKISCLFDGSKILYGIFGENQETSEIYCLNLETMTSEWAFQDTRNLQYRLYDQVGDQFVFKMYYEGLFGDGYKAYIISKEDYLHGNFDAKQEIKLR